MKKDSKQRLFEVMGRLDKTFKPKLNETTLSYGTDYDNPNDDYQADNDIKQKAEDLYDRGLTMFNSGDIDGAEKLRQEALKISSSLGWSENELPPFSESPENPMDEKYNKWSQSQDAWADIESGGQPNNGKELAKKVSQEKRGDRPSREMGSGSGDSHVPEYYYSYDSDDPISNVNGLTQGEIDAKNQAWRDNMERNMRGSYDNMYESRKKSGKQRLFEVMQRVDKTFKHKLNEGRYTGYERLDPPDDYWGDDNGPSEPENPEIKTPDFELYGGIENHSNEYLYTVYEVVPNSQFGDVLMQAMKYADDNSSWNIEHMKKYPNAPEIEYKRDNKGIFGHDFGDEDIPRIKEVLNKYTNVKGVPEFITAMEKVSGEMAQYKEDKDAYDDNVSGRDRDDNFREPDNDRDYNSSDPKNAWMDYINEADAETSPDLNKK